MKNERRLEDLPRITKTSSPDLDFLEELSPEALTYVTVLLVKNALLEEELESTRWELRLLKIQQLGGK
jgi:hypothetical protein